MKKVKKLKKKKKKKKSPKLSSKKGKPKIAVITTGGTITSRVDYETGAVKSLTNPEELLAQIPELKDIVSVELVSPFSKLSEDMDYSHWQKLAKLVKKELKKKSIRGAVVTQGTDTLHFTSAALAFMLGELDKPVAVVGGQRSSDRGSFDGAQNLICAAHYCLSDINQVAVVMHGSPDDKYCLAIPGTRARKMHTSRRDAFRPINSLPLAKIYPDGKLEKVAVSKGSKDSKADKKRRAATKFSTSFEPKIALVKYAPGLGSYIFKKAARKSKGIIIEGTGLGHVSVEGEKSWLGEIKKAVKKGKFVGMTSQCLYGRTDPKVYSNGRKLEKAGVVYLKDMLPETAYVKLGCVLGRGKKGKAATKSMRKNWAGEISKRIEKRSFLY